MSSVAVFSRLGWTQDRRDGAHGGRRVGRPFPAIPATHAHPAKSPRHRDGEGPGALACSLPTWRPSRAGGRAAGGASVNAARRASGPRALGQTRWPEPLLPLTAERAVRLRATPRGMMLRTPRFQRASVRRREGEKISTMFINFLSSGCNRRFKRAALIFRSAADVLGRKLSSQLHSVERIRAG